VLVESVAVVELVGVEVVEVELVEELVDVVEEVVTELEVESDVVVKFNVKLPDEVARLFDVVEVAVRHEGGVERGVGVVGSVELVELVVELCGHHKLRASPLAPTTQKPSFSEYDAKVSLQKELVRLNVASSQVPVSKIPFPQTPNSI